MRGSESDGYKRDILTSIVGPRAERVESGERRDIQSCKSEPLTAFAGQRGSDLKENG